MGTRLCGDPEGGGVTGGGRETLWVSLGLTKGAEQGSQMRTAWKTALRPQWLCACVAGWGLGARLGLAVWRGQPLGGGAGRG